MLDHLDRLPPPQRDALETVFGVAAGPVPDRFVVGLATLGLLSEVAEKQPLVCLIDDHQWLDQASRQVLAFVARRLGAESLGLAFATRLPDEELTGLPQLLVTGLEEKDARALLDSVLPGRWTRGYVTRSWPRPEATRWPCWSCPGAARRTSWPAGSRSRTARL